MRTYKSIALLVAASMALGACGTTTKTELLKVYPGGAYEFAAAMGDSPDDCGNAARTLNEAKSKAERASFVCVTTPAR